MCETMLLLGLGGWLFESPPAWRHREPFASAAALGASVSHARTPRGQWSIHPGFTAPVWPLDWSYSICMHLYINVNI